MSNMLENQVKALVARHFGISPSKVRLDDSFLADLGISPEAMIRGLAAFRESVYAKRPPKKTVTVRYSARPISGLDSFAAAEKLCDGQVMDRPFGGATDMLESYRDEIARRRAAYLQRNLTD